MADVMQFCGVTDPHAQHRYVGGSMGDPFDFYFCCPGSIGPVDFEARYRALRAGIEALAAELRSSERGVPGYFTQGYTAGLERAGERLAALLAETGDTE